MSLYECVIADSANNCTRLTFHDLCVTQQNIVRICFVIIFDQSVIADKRTRLRFFHYFFSMFSTIGTLIDDQVDFIQYDAISWNTITLRDLKHIANNDLVN